MKKIGGEMRGHRASQAASSGTSAVKINTITKASTTAFRSSLLIAEQNIPTAREKSRLFTDTSSTLQNSAPVTPPANNGMAITGKMASIP